MLQVNNINFANAINTKRSEETYKKRGKSNHPDSTNVSFNHTIPSELLGRSMISFKSSNYYDESGETPFWLTIHMKQGGGNYFKLPQNARPDKYQIKAARALYQGKDVLVTAPTGTGKTAIAFYVITKNLTEGKKTFYTTPLKALSNEKYRQLQALFGERNVGLLTGDVKIKPEAPIVVMTTEIYRNMLMDKNLHPQKVSRDYTNNLADLKTVIFDELHYMGDVDRGGIWEQSIILSDKATQLLSLSATIGNNQEINNWINQIRGKESTLIDVPSKERHVPLYFKNENCETKKTPKKNNDDSEYSPPPSFDSYLKMIELLKKREQLPVILFVFSKKASKDLLRFFTENANGIDLNTRKEKDEIEKILSKYEKEGKYLGTSLNVKALKKGYAIHNSGLLPAQKELIEELFQNKLIKVVIATETLSAGINMPARTVVISSTRKPTSVMSSDEDGRRDLTANEFHQMAGRAGRRGIDTNGYVYTMSTKVEQKQQFEDLIKAPSNPIESHFIPEYSFIAHYHKYSQDDDMIKVILGESLKAYQGDGEELFDNFELRRNTLKSENFINPDNTLTLKGKLLTKLHGYQQIPIIDMIHSKKLGSLTPEQLAACVGTMAMVDEEVAARLKRNQEYNKIRKHTAEDIYAWTVEEDPYTDEFDTYLATHPCVDKEAEGDFEDNKPEKQTFSHKDCTLVWFVDEFNNYLDEYNYQMAELNPDFYEIAQDTNVAKHLYKWAELNKNNPNAIENWEDLYRNSPAGSIKDEGCLFQEIIKTIDLLKQIVKISEIGAANSQSQTDKDYYQDLKATAQKTITLIQKAPIPVSGNKT